MEKPYTTEELIRYLRHFWEKAEGIDYGHEHEVMRCAADRLEKLARERLQLDQRIHKQRVMLRENWQIIEMRAQYKRAWYPSKLLSAILRNRLSHSHGNGQSR